MSTPMEDEIKRWTVKRKSALVMQIKQLQEAHGEAMLELRARKKMQALLGEDEK